MSYKRKILFSFATSMLLMMIVLLSSITTCQRIEPELILKLTTDTIETLPDGEYRFIGSIVSFGEEVITQHGFCWSTSSNPTSAGQSTKLGGIDSKGSFSSVVSDLSLSTRYYVRAYVVSNAGAAYGNEKSFTTPAPGSPLVTTIDVSDVTRDSAHSGGVITDDGGAPITTKGVCWDTIAAPDLTDKHTTDGGGSESYASSMTGLDCGTKYYVRAYAINAADTAYGNQEEFTTSQCPLIQSPTVTTAPVSNITANSAEGGGVVTVEGGSVVTARGVCWSSSAVPLVTDAHSIDGTGPGSFTSSIAVLSKSTTYYVRAYATNSAGTGYGDVDTLKTYERSIADNDGNEYLTVIIGDQEWTVENLKTTSLNDGSGIRLEIGAAAWANLEIPAYSWYNNEEVPMKNTYGALYNGYAIFSHRLCPAGWHVSAYEDWDVLIAFLGGSEIAGDKLKETGTDHWNGANEGATNEFGFTALPSGARSYQGNFFGMGSTGNFYSPSSGGTNFAKHIESSSGIDEGSFNMETGFSVRCVEGEKFYIPTTKTNSVSSITAISATVEGAVVSDGGVSVTERGVCWSTGTDPHISDSYDTDGSGMGSFSVTLTNLLPNTTYYARAYAINSIGTAYGDTIRIKTLWNSTVTVTDRDGNEYETVKIGDQVWMRENLKTTLYADGTPIPPVEDSATWAALTTTGEAYCFYDNELANGNIYGALYTWAAAMKGEGGSDSNPSGIQGVCPNGWHLPSDAEWKELEMSLGMSQADADASGWRGAPVGGDMKEEGESHWLPPNTGASNASDFTALPAGGRHTNGGSFGIGYDATFWAASEGGSATQAWGRYIAWDSSDVVRVDFYKNYGWSVRCVEDD